jgi:hypothetical protein
MLAMTLTLAMAAGSATRPLVSVATHMIPTVDPATPAVASPFPAATSAASSASAVVWASSDSAPVPVASEASRVVLATAPTNPAAPAAVSAPANSAPVPAMPAATPLVSAGAPSNSSTSAAPGGATHAPIAAAACLSSGDGYLRARVAGAIDRSIDWPNSGTRCQGETKAQPAGVRLSFQRDPSGKENLLFVFGLTGIREGQPAREVGTNLTLIVQGSTKIYSTLGDSRCTVDSLAQKPLAAAHSYRLEARGFCTQPAHAVRGNGAVLVSTFEFAGVVNYDADVSDADIPAVAPQPSVKAQPGANR